MRAAFLLLVVGGQALPIFLLAGQSNMKGYGTSEKTSGSQPIGSLYYAKDSSQMQAVLEQLWECNSSTPTELNDVKVIAYTDIDSQSNPAGKVDALSVDPAEELAVGSKSSLKFFGPELGFGFGMHHGKESAGISGDMLILKIAKGGTNLGWDWKPPSRRTTAHCEDLKAAGVAMASGKNCNNLGSIGWGSLYDKMMVQVNRYLNSPSELNRYLPSLGEVSPFVAGFGWYQGTSDYYTGTHSFYKDDLIHLIQDVRTAVSTPELPAVVAESGHFGHEPTTVDTWDRLLVEQAQMQATRNLANAITMDTRDLWRSYGPATSSDEWIHYYWNGENVFFVGQAMAHGMISLMKGEKGQASQQWDTTAKYFKRASAEASNGGLANVGEGFCHSGGSGWKELSRDLGEAGCLAAAQADDACLNKNVISYGKGTRYGRCLCDQVANCTADARGLGSDGYTRFTIQNNFSDVGDGFCYSGGSGWKELDKHLGVDGCFAAAQQDTACANKNAISYGQGSRSGRCLCDKVASCSPDDRGLGSNGYDRFSVTAGTDMSPRDMKLSDLPATIRPSGSC